jgi:hypothetical protein
VIGGYVYRGTLYPLLQGSISSAICARADLGPRHSGQTWTMSPVLASELPISSFGEDVNGELYVVSIGGALYPIMSAAHRVLLPAALYNL